MVLHGRSHHKGDEMDASCKLSARCGIVAHVTEALKQTCFGNVNAAGQRRCNMLNSCKSKSQRCQAACFVILELPDNENQLARSSPQRRAAYYSRQTREGDGGCENVVVQGSHIGHGLAEFI